MNIESCEHQLCERILNIRLGVAQLSTNLEQAYKSREDELGYAHFPGLLDYIAVGLSADLKIIDKKLNELHESAHSENI